MRILRTVALSIAMVATLGACNIRQATESVELRPLHHSLQCKLAGTIAGDRNGRWLRQTTELPDHLRHLAVDFSRESVVALFLGVRPSGGYGIELQARQARIEGDRAIVPVQLRQPTPGMMQIQMLTSPCLYFAIENGGYREIEVVDQHGEPAWSLTSPNG